MTEVTQNRTAAAEAKPEKKASTAFLLLYSWSPKSLHKPNGISESSQGENALSNAPPLTLFLPDAPDTPDAEGITPRVHIGDLHKTFACVQHHCNLIAIVDNVNSAFASSIAFMFLPGDVADDGSDIEDTVVCGALMRGRGTSLKINSRRTAHTICSSKWEMPTAVPLSTISGVSSEIQQIRPPDVRSGIRILPWRTGPNAVRSALISAQTSMGESGR